MQTCYLHKVQGYSGELSSLSSGFAVFAHVVDIFCYEQMQESKLKQKQNLLNSPMTKHTLNSH